MKKLLLFTTIITFSFLGCKAQNIFQKTFGTYVAEVGNKVKQTSDKGFIILSIANYNSTYLIKTDSLGNKIWSKVINYRGARDIIQTHDGNYVIVGETEWLNGNDSPFIIKLDASGNIVWQNSYGFFNIHYFNCVREDIDGSGYIVGGTDYGSTALLAKINNAGAVVWNQSIFPLGTTQNYPEVDDIAQSTVDSSFFALGSYRYGPSSRAIIVSKFLKNGSGVWTKSFSSTGMYTSYIISALSIEETYNRNMMLSFQDGSNLDLIEFDTSGTTTSTGIRYNYSINTYWNWRFAEPRINNSLFLSSTYLGDILLSKTNSSDNIIWAKKIGGISDDGINDLVSTKDNGVVLAGYTKSFSVGQSDVYLLKTDSLGSFSCNASTYTFPAVQFPASASTNLNCSFQHQTYTNVAQSYFLISNVNDTSYDACGCIPPKANFSTGYPNYNFGAQDNSTWATTWFWDFGDGHTSTSQSPYHQYLVDSASYLICLKVTNACGSDSVCHPINYIFPLPNSIIDVSKNLIISISPNPFTSQTNIAFAQEQKNTTIKIVDVLGKEIKSINFTGKELIIEKEEMQTGIYFVQIQTEKGTITKKLILNK